MILAARFLSEGLVLTQYAVRRALIKEQYRAAQSRIAQMRLEVERQTKVASKLASVA